MARKRIYPPSVDPGIPKLPDSPPSGWSRIAFGSALEVVSRPVKLEPSAVYRLVVAKRNRGGIELRREALGADVKTPTQFLIAAGDFLISRRQIIHGACGIVPDELDGAVVSNEYSSLRTRDCLEMAFLQYFSTTRYFQRTTFHSSHGVDVEKMIFKLEEWLRREFDCPPLPEQRKIAAILGSVDALIERTQAVIDQVEVVKKGLMQELLTRGLPGRHTRFKQTEIGEVPESWEVVSLGAVAEIDGGFAFKSRDFCDGGVPIVRMSNLKRGALDLSDAAQVPLDVVEGLERFRLEAGDILLGLSGSIGPTGSLGNFAEVSSRDRDCYLNQRVGRLRTRDNTKLHQGYLKAVVASDHFRDETQALSTSLAQANVSPKQLRALQRPLPSLSEQREIAELVAAVDSRRQAEMAACEGLRVLKAALSNVLLSGEVRVQTSDSEVAA